MSAISPSEPLRSLLARQPSFFPFTSFPFSSAGRLDPSTLTGFEGIFQSLRGPPFLPLFFIRPNLHHEQQTSLLGFVVRVFVNGCCCGGAQEESLQGNGGRRHCPRAWANETFWRKSKKGCLLSHKLFILLLLEFYCFVNNLSSSHKSFLIVIVCY